MNAVEDTTLAIACQAMVQQDREVDALGVYWLAGPCTCGPHSAGTSGWSIVTVRPTVQLHFCGDCGRGSNRDDVLGVEPWRKGDVAVVGGQLATITSAPGPTGVAHLAMLDGHTLTMHVVLLNLED